MVSTRVSDIYAQQMCKAGALSSAFPMGSKKSLVQQAGRLFGPWCFAWNATVARVMFFLCGLIGLSRLGTVGE